jgi:hypothetical protein
MKRERRTLLIFYPINDSFGCFIEYSGRFLNRVSSISLVEYDFIDKIFRKIRTFKLNDCWNERIFMNEFDSSKFILTWKTNGALHIQIFHLLNGTINIENTAQYADCGFWIDHYFDGSVYRCRINGGTWDNVS